MLDYEQHFLQAHSAIMILLFCRILSLLHVKNIDKKREREDKIMVSVSVYKLGVDL